MKKEVRQKKIAQLIKKHKVSNQESLLEALKDEGIQATQATVSRDIREMQIIKDTDAAGETYYTIFQNEKGDAKQKIAERINELVTEVTNVHFINVVKTTPRNANVLAALIDDEGLEGIVGTLAGYDTLVLFSPDDETALKITKYFKQNLGS